MLQVLLSGDPNFDNVKNINDQHVVVMHDVFYQEDLDKVLKKGKPKYLISDTFAEVEFTGMRPICLSLACDYYARKFTNCILDHDVQTHNSFNFCINKKQINRFLCIKLVELFELQNFDYTWSGVDNNFDLSFILNELNTLGNKSPISHEAKSFLLSPIMMPKKWVEYKNNFNSGSSVTNFGGESWAWNNGLNRLFSSSAISLITESVAEQKGIAFTEKTLYSVLGLTFPIWVGGYNQANQWQKLGFDTFDDIIDHSYQHYNTLIQRCWHAIVDNLELLKDKKRLQDLRAENFSRLVKNRDFLIKTGMADTINSRIQQLPPDLKQVFPEISKWFQDSYDYK